jgi:hypothetical protein
VGKYLKKVVTEDVHLVTILNYVTCIHSYVTVCKVLYSRVEKYSTIDHIHSSLELAGIPFQHTSPYFTPAVQQMFAVITT